MKLADYLEAHGISYTEFARILKVGSVETVRRYALGERTPRKKHMASIVEATGGKVTANDFHGVAA